MILLLFPTDFPRTHLRTFKKVRRNCFRSPIVLKINTPFFNSLYGGTDVCGGSFRHFRQQRRQPPLLNTTPHYSSTPSYSTTPPKALYSTPLRRISNWPLRSNLVTSHRISSSTFSTSVGKETFTRIVTYSSIDNCSLLSFS